LVTDCQGLALTVDLTAGKANESICDESVMNQIVVPHPLGRPRQRRKQLADDKGFSNNRMRD
jgi:hypothetical protein